jgi:hypothetical protein
VAQVSSSDAGTDRLDQPSPGGSVAPLGRPVDSAPGDAHAFPRIPAVKPEFALPPLHPGGQSDRPGLRRLVDVVLVASLMLQCALATMWATDSGWWSDDTAGDVATPVAAEAPPRSAPDPGVLVRSRLTARASLVVTQWLTFDEVVGRLPLSVDPAAIGASDDVATEVRRLRVTAGGAAVAAPVTTLAAGESAVLDLGVPVRTARLDYVVEGAVERSRMSAPGRAVADLNPVHVSVPGSVTPQVLQVSAAADGAVLSMACASGGDLPTPCGRDARRGWSVRLPDAVGQDVIASVDLPRP